MRRAGAGNAARAGAAGRTGAAGVGSGASGPAARTSNDGDAISATLPVTGLKVEIRRAGIVRTPGFSGVTTHCQVRVDDNLCELRRIESRDSGSEIFAPAIERSGAATSARRPSPDSEAVTENEPPGATSVRSTELFRVKLPTGRRSPLSGTGRKTAETAGASRSTGRDSENGESPKRSKKSERTAISARAAPMEIAPGRFANSALRIIGYACQLAPAMFQTCGRTFGSRSRSSAQNPLKSGRALISPCVARPRVTRKSVQTVCCPA